MTLSARMDMQISAALENPRLRLMLGDLSLATSRGLEIGALHKPLVSRQASDVRYVDYATTEELRANQFDPAVTLSDIVEVDIVWGGQPLPQLVGEPVDYVVASHVIEHVPDLIGWLHELHGVLKPGGVLGLAFPDKRFTFDRLRHDTVSPTSSRPSWRSVASRLFARCSTAPPPPFPSTPRKPGWSRYPTRPPPSRCWSG